MEIRCSNCSHLGAATVVPLEGGVGLVCGGCGHVNILGVGAGTDKQVKTPGEKDSQVLAARLLPTPGEGERCRKCAHLLEIGEEYCARCGLSRRVAARFAKGQAPWEVAPPGKEALFAQGERLWANVLWRGEGEAIEAFVDFVLDEDLLDFGTRKLQYFLVEHPDHPQAVAGLARLAKKLELVAELVRSRAAVAGESFPKDVERVRERFLIGAAVMFGALIFILLSFVF